MKQLFRSLIVFISSLLFFPVTSKAALPPAPDHVVILVLENHGYNQIVGSSAAPYLNGLINDPYCALFTQSFGISHPSQPNYLQLFSGSNQGVIDDNVPALLPFTSANLGAELLAASKTFIGYSEDLPSVGSTIASSGNYARKHNPWVNWQGNGINGIPSNLNQPLSAFPSDFNLLPTVSFVIPNQANDMHNGSDPARITTGDTWVQSHLDAYIQWAKSHNSLLIITFDEDDNLSNQQILTMFIGNAVLHGSYTNTINHYNVLRLIEDLYSLPHAGSASTATTIDYCWNPCVASLPKITPEGAVPICTGSSRVLTASSANSYLWSTGLTTQSITVNSAGTYLVTTTNLNGCSGTSAPVTTSLISSWVFNETLGVIPSSPTTIASFESTNGFDNDNLTISGTADLRLNPTSTGYATASGSTNVFITNVVGKDFIISGINTLGLSNLQLSFGIYKSTIATTGSELLLQVSDNGGPYTNVSFPPLPTGSGTALWHYRTTTGNIPSSSNLSIRFVQNGTVPQFRIDDIVLKSSTIPSITAGGPTTFCEGDSVTITASAGTNYLWNTGATTQTIKAYTSGNYSATVDCIPTNTINVTTTICDFTLNVKAFIQGFYSGSGVMLPVLNTSNLNSDPTACDTITIELHQSVSPYDLVIAQNVLLHANGLAEALLPTNLLGSSYFIIIKHRNSVETWSKTAILFNAATVSYDFSIPDQPVINNPIPLLTALSPTFSTAGNPGFNLLLSGSNFINGSIVKWNGVSLVTTFNSATQLTATIPSGNIALAGTASVTVFNPTPGGGTSTSQTFTINPPDNPVPVLTTLSPTSVTSGSSGFSLIVTGSNFISGSIVKWNGVSLVTTFNSATQLTATIPTGNITTAGTASVTVFNPTPGGGTSTSQTFTINNVIPILSSISPTSITAGSAGFSLIVTGSNFISGSIVKWNGVSLVTTFNSATQLTATIPTGNITTAGTASVTVFNPTPGGGTSTGQTFTINPPVIVPKKFLFDATKAETAANADWVIDEDPTIQRFPFPAASTIVSTTPETYWKGAISNWGIDLVKSGNSVETLPSGGVISYGNSSNPQDLSNYDVYVVDEPNILFTSTEKTAILNFINNGGGLFMISDHTGSDRNNDGADSPAIWNDLMNNNTVQINPFGFSIDNTNITQVSSNVRTNSSTNKILNGSQGPVTQLSFNNGATITINNPTIATGLIWKTGVTQNNLNIMSASATFGLGRIYVVTDSSPMDDGTGAAGENLFIDWINYSHTELFMNASLWLAKLQ